MRQILFIWLIYCSYLLHSQVGDTLYLDTVQIKSVRISVLDGLLPIQHIQSNDKTQSISTLLTTKAIYFRQYGFGQTSSIVFRGSNPSQTQLLWQGIPANYPSLGQMDFSQIPLWFIDEIKVSSGNNVLFGSQSLGGTISLNESISFTPDENKGKILVTGGSFGLISKGSFYTYSNNKFNSKSWIWIEKRNNDFPYFHENESLKQTNSAQKTSGLQQRITYQYKRGFLLGEIHHSTQDRQIQPNKSAPHLSDSLATRNTRIVARFQFYKNWLSFDATASHFQFWQKFNQDSPIQTRQWAIQNVNEIDVNRHSKIKIGLLTVLNRAYSDNYTDLISEWQQQIYGSVEKQLLKERWISQLYIRYFIDPFGTKTAPALAQKIIILSSYAHTVSLSHSLSTNYRIPTLNDRYWIPGGNPTLNPEQGNTHEVNISFSKKMIKMEYSIQTTGYNTNSKHWIVWLPSASGYWSPYNLQDVNLQGVELRHFFKRNFNYSQYLEISHNSQWSRNKVLKGIGAGASLPYTPSMLHSIISKWNSKSFSIQLTATKTGQQFTQLGAENNQKLPGWWLVDHQMAYKLSVKNIDYQFILKINNMLGKEYESIENYAMPGRNYEFSLQLQFSKK